MKELRNKNHSENIDKKKQNHEKSHDSFHKETIINEPPKKVYKETKNKAAEMLTFVPKIEKIAESLKKEYWINQIVYTWNQRLSLDESITTSQCYFEQTFKEIHTNIVIIAQEIKKYPKGIKLPTSIVLSAQIAEKEYVEEIFGEDRSLYISPTDQLNKKWWHYSLNKKSQWAIYLNSWRKNIFSHQKLAETFHHEVLHLQDEEYDWLNDDNFIWERYISKYSYESINEAQAELMTSLYTDPLHVLECIRSELKNWESSILKQVSLLTWHTLDQEIIKQWNREERPLKIFDGKLTKNQLLKLWIYTNEFYSKRLPEIDQTFWNSMFEKWFDNPMICNDREILRKKKNQARIFFDSYIQKKYDEYKNHYLHWKWETEDFLKFIATIYEKKLEIGEIYWSQHNNIFYLKDFLNTWSDMRKSTHHLESITNALCETDDFRTFFDLLDLLSKKSNNSAVQSVIRALSRKYLEEKIILRWNLWFDEIIHNEEKALSSQMIAIKIDKLYKNLNKVILSWNIYAIKYIKYMITPWFEYRGETINYFHESIENTDIFLDLYNEKWKPNTIKETRNFTPSQEFNKALQKWEIFTTPFDYLRYKAEKDWNQKILKIIE